MKSEFFNKRSQSTQLRGHREKPKSKQVNWDRIVYFVVLVFVIGFLIYYLFLSTFYVSGEGLVVTETVKIRAPQDIEIREQLVSRNSYVSAGQPIFRYSLMNWTGNTDEVEQLDENIADRREEIEEIRDDITLKRQSIQEIEDQIAYQEQQREDVLDKVRLNAATSYELDEVENALFSTRSNLRQAQSELSVLVDNLNRHIQAQENLERNIQELESGEKSMQTYFAPVSGRVHDIFVSENQQAFRSDQIISIKPSRADVYIFSVFDREDAEYVRPGTVMNIEFDNGEESIGVIRSSYDARENLINHFEKTGSLTTEYFVVEVIPLDSTTRAKWMELDRSGLSIYRKIVGGEEVSLPDQNINTSETELNSFENAEEELNPSESDSVSVQPDRPSVSNSSPSSDEKSSELITNAQADEESTINHTDYGLMGDSFHDELAGYSINLHSFDEQEKAILSSEKIKKEGYRVKVYSVSIEGQDMWRVSVGQFKTIEDAQTAAESLPPSVAESYFINRIK